MNIRAITNSVCILIVFSFLACGRNKDAKNNIVTISDPNDSPIVSQSLVDSNASQGLPPIPPDCILEKWENPVIILHQCREGEFDRNYLYMRLLDSSWRAFDTTLFDDATMSVNSVSIDSIRFGAGKYPEIIFKWFSAGEHSYGPGLGGWTVRAKTISIWDINSFENIFYTDIESYGWSGERRHPEDTLVDIEKDMEIDEGSRNTTLVIDTLQKKMTLNIVEDKNNKIKKWMEVYHYKNGKFVLAKTGRKK